MQIPEFDKERKTQTAMVAGVLECTADEFLERAVGDICEVFPDRPVFDIILSYFRPVCITSLLDPQLNELLTLESMCSEYHTLPDPGGILDQPAALMEAFVHIRSARAMFERDELAKIEAKAKEGGKK